MNRRLFRPATCVLPLGLLALSFINARGTAILLAIMAFDVFSLGARYAFTLAAGSEFDKRRVDGLTSTAGLMLIPALIVFTIIGGVAAQIALICLCITLSRLYTENMWVNGRRKASVVCDLITAGIVIAVTAFSLDWRLMLAVSPAVAAVSVNTFWRGGSPGGKPNAKLFKALPLGFARAAAYPLAALALSSITEFSPIDIAAGYVIMCASESVFRRDEYETRPLNAVLLVICAVSAAFGLIHIPLACVIAAALYAKPSVLIYAGFAACAIGAGLTYITEYARYLPVLALIPATIYTKDALVPVMARLRRK